MIGTKPGAKMVVIDTENYAGNFERQMCAFVTGRIGECGVGDVIAREAAPDIRNMGWWKTHSVMVADEKGCSRPVSIWPTSGWFNNGMGGHFRDNPDNYAEAREQAFQAMVKYNKHQNDVIKLRLENSDFETATDRGGWTEEACRRTLEGNEASERRVRDDETRHPAYLSVALFVSELPRGDVLDELKDRARKFCRDHPRMKSWKSAKEISLTGFRLFESETVCLETSV